MLIVSYVTSSILSIGMSPLNFRIAPTRKHCHHPRDEIVEAQKSNLLEIK